MSTTRRKAADLRLGDQIELPKTTVRLLEWKKVRYYRLPGTKGNLKAVQIEYTDGPMKGHKAVVVFEENDQVSYVLKDPLLKRAIKASKKLLPALKEYFFKPKQQIKEPEYDLCSDWGGYKGTV